MRLIKSFFVFSIVLTNLVNAQAVVVTGITDPSYINMSIQSMQTNAQMLSQLASSVQNIQYNYQMSTANNDLTANFASFASIFSTISHFMQNYVCQDCTPGAWNQQQYDQFENNFCQQEEKFDEEFNKLWDDSINCKNMLAFNPRFPYHIFIETIGIILFYVICSNFYKL